MQVLKNGKYWSAMSLIIAKDSYYYASVEDVIYRSAMSLIIASDSDVNASVRNGVIDQLFH